MTKTIKVMVEISIEMISPNVVHQIFQIIWAFKVGSRNQRGFSWIMKL